MVPALLTMPVTQGINREVIQGRGKRNTQPILCYEKKNEDVQS